ncbi:hypothetical protein D5266_03205 [bacterium c-19]|nr:hypothetical protein [bacterium c-19]
MIKKLFFVLCLLCALSGCKIGEKSINEHESNVDTAEALEQVINKQEVHIVKTNYIVQDTKIKILFPDTLQAVIKNNSKDKIKNVVVSFAAWDENNEPVKLKRSIDFTEGAYVREITLKNIDLASGATFAEEDGFGLNEKCSVHTFKAIVKSYETDEGAIWENPQYNNWVNMYSGVNYSSFSLND